MHNKTILILVCCLSLLFWSCKQQYAYRSKVRVNHSQLVQTKPALDIILPQKEVKIEASQAEASAGIDGFILPKIAPEIQLEFGRKKNPTVEKIAPELAIEKGNILFINKSIKPKAGKNNMLLYLGILLLFISPFLVFVFPLFSILLATFSLFVIIKNIRKRHKINDKEQTEEGNYERKNLDEYQSKKAQKLKLFCSILLAISLLSIFGMLGVWVFFLFLFAAPALLGAGIVGLKFNYEKARKGLFYLSTIIGILGTIFMFIVFPIIFFYSLDIILIALAISLVTYLLGWLFSKWIIY